MAPPQEPPEPPGAHRSANAPFSWSGCRVSRSTADKQPAEPWGWVTRRDLGVESIRVQRRAGISLGNQKSKKVSPGTPLSPHPAPPGVGVGAETLWDLKFRGEETFGNSLRIRWVHSCLCFAPFWGNLLPRLALPSHSTIPVVRSADGNRGGSAGFWGTGTDPGGARTPTGRPVLTGEERRIPSHAS